MTCKTHSNTSELNTSNRRITSNYSSGRLQQHMLAMGLDCVNITVTQRLVRLKRKACRWKASSLFHYSRQALTTSLVVIKTAVALWEPDYRHTEDFTLGYDAISGGESEEKYWDAVRYDLQALMVQNQHYERPSKIILTGDMALNERFTRVLREAMVNVIGKVPPIFSSSPEFVAAKGAAEFRRRKAF